MGNMESKLEIQPKTAKRLNEVDDIITLAAAKKPKTDVIPLRLIDINYDCLLQIFQYLDVDSLVNIAEADDQFIPAAVTVYSHCQKRYEKVIMNIYRASLFKPDDWCRSPSSANIEPFFRHFGHGIFDLFINFDLNPLNINMGRLLQDHCAATLNNLDLGFFNADEMESIEKPFTALKKLTFIEGTLGQKLSQINIWFANITSLELIYINLAEPRSIEINIPRLKRLQIYNGVMNIPEENICEMLRLNPQLEDLSLLCEFDIDFLLSLSQNLPLLETLEIWSPENRFETFGSQKVRFDMVKSFTLNACSHRGDSIANMPFEFVQLQQLSFDGFNRFRGPILDFIFKCGDLVKLNLLPQIEDWDDLDIFDLERLVEALPHLNELAFCADCFIVQHVINFLTASEQLKKVEMMYIEPVVCSHFYAAIEKKWYVNTATIKTGCSYIRTEHHSIFLERKN